MASKWFTKGSLAQLQEKVCLKEVVEEFLSLRQVEEHYLTHCPFHGEENLSFAVFPHNNRYYCCGCEAYGDAVTFLMAYKMMGFSEAIEYLAVKFEVTLEMIDLTNLKKDDLFNVLKKEEKEYELTIPKT